MNNINRSYAHLSAFFRWKTIGVTVDNWNENQLQLVKSFILGSDATQSLYLQESCWHEADPSNQIQMSPEELTELLCHASNLKSLSLDADVLIRISPINLTTQLQERHSALESLRIFWENNGSE